MVELQTQKSRHGDRIKKQLQHQNQTSCCSAALCDLMTDEAERRRLQLQLLEKTN
jgi:hypothetical protein